MLPSEVHTLARPDAACVFLKWATQKANQEAKDLLVFTFVQSKTDPQHRLEKKE